MVASCSPLVQPLWIQKSYLVAVVVLLLKQCWRWWRRRRRRIFEEDRRRRVILDRLAESSRGLTAALLLWNDNDNVVLVEWIEKLASSKKRRNQKAVIDFIAGALWFRFHVVGDYQLQLTAASVMEDCDTLLRWTLELMPPFKNLYALTKCCIEAILALDADVLPAKVVELLVEEVLLSYYQQHHQQDEHDEQGTPSDCPASMRIRECSQRIQCYMVFLNLLKRSDDDHEGLVRVSDACSIFSFQPHYQHHLPLFRRQRFIELLLFAAAADDNNGNPLGLRAFLPRICTNLRFYERAQRLLQDSATARAYCWRAEMSTKTTTIASGSSRRSGVWLTAARKWIQDVEYLAASMQEGLVSVPQDFRAATLRCMVDCLVQRAAVVAVTAAPGENDYHHDLRSLSGPQGEEWNDCLAAADAFCLLASSNLPLISSSSSGSASMDATLACLEHASNIMMRLFTSSCFGIAQAVWYVGIVYWTRGDKATGSSCLVASKSLEDKLRPNPQTLLDVLHQNVKPLFGKPFNKDSCDDEGIEFCMHRIRNELERLAMVCGRISNLLDTNAIQADDGDCDDGHSFSIHLWNRDTFQAIRLLSQKLSAKVS